MCQIFDMRQIADPPHARTRAEVPASGARILLFTGCFRERYERLPKKWEKAAAEGRATISPRERLGATRGKRTVDGEGLKGASGAGHAKKDARKAPARGGKRA